MAAFACGIAASSLWPWVPAVGLFAAAAGAAAIAMVTSARPCNAAMLASVMLLGAAWTTARVHSIRPDRIDTLLHRDGAASPDALLARVRGVVLDAPRPVVRDAAAPWESDRVIWRVRLAIRALVGDDGSVRRASGELTVRIDAPADGPGPEAWGWRAGDAVETLGRFTPPGGALNPGEADWAALARQRGSGGSLIIADGRELAPVPHADGVLGAADAALSPLRRLRAAAHARVLRALRLGSTPDASAPDRTRALRGALLLGLHEPGADELGESFRDLGVAHLLAISGFHLAALAGLVLWAARAAGEWGRAEQWVAAGVVLAYAALLPAEAPIARSAALFAALVLSEALGRRYDRLAVLAWVTLALLVWRPLDAGSLGLRLSVGITALLLWMHGRARTDGPPIAPAARGLVAAAWRRARAAAWVCIACWLVSAPIVAHQTGSLSLVGWLATLLLSPLIVAALGTGFAAALIGVVWPAAAGVLLGPLDAVLSASVAAVSWADGFSWVQIAVPRPGLIAAVGLTAAIVLLAGRVRRGRWFAAAAVVLSACWISWRSQAPMHPSIPLRMDTLAVGDGACHLLRSGQDAMLWDCGSLARADLGRRLVPRALSALGVRSVPSAAVSHANLDHFNGLADAAARGGLRRVWVTPAMLDAAQRSPETAELLARLSALGVRTDPMAAGTSFALGAARVDVLWPPADPAQRVGLSDNDLSTVALVRVDTLAGERRVLFCGDLQPAGMERLERTAGSLRADVIELPHHGSARPEAVAFVERVGPAVVVQSTGRSRASDPRWDTARAGRVWRTTAVHGRVAVEIRADGSIAVWSGPDDP